MTEATPRVSPGLRWAARAGGVLFVLAVTVLWVLEFHVADAFMLGVLFLVMPALSLAQLPALRAMEVERLPAYRSSIVSLVLLGGLALGIGTRDSGLSAIGWTALAPVPLVVWSVGLTLGLLVVVLLFREISLRFDLHEEPLLEKLLPTNAQERREFAVVSLAAGVGEETAYRGYAIPVLIPLLGVGGSVAATSIAFGVMHGYQGWIGVLRTGILGAILAAGFIASGSLVPAMIAHTVFDILAGIVLGRRLLVPKPASGVEEQVPTAPSEEPS